ncbi:uncharacterized protein C8A04DRAFT_26767 [Dichotomopilus funicola]|uniref:WSC domain-containing protein n=1 Tax=Dichotomopilus funicola TaxID=1934379 RepID=A0AAN6V666_9PEZI|nr:hypothetical protein C8A04DRAFT_26767 [Dichotomopilus funicola]
MRLTTLTLTTLFALTLATKPHHNTHGSGDDNDSPDTINVPGAPHTTPDTDTQDDTTSNTANTQNNNNSPNPNPTNTASSSTSTSSPKPNTSPPKPKKTNKKLIHPTDPASHYSYLGCYNETTGIRGTTGTRALNGGKNEAVPGQMTVEKCWTFCSTGAGDAKGGRSGRFEYAGLEYARECWCAQSLSSLATKLGDNDCDLGCEGNDSQACGGNLKLTVYKASDAATIRVFWTGLAIAGVVSLALL